MRGLSLAVRLSCRRLSLSSNPLGLISSACLQREGDLQGLIITQAKTPSQRCSLHWNNPLYCLLFPARIMLLYLFSACVWIQLCVMIYICRCALNAVMLLYSSVIASDMKASMAIWKQKHIESMLNVSTTARLFRRFIFATCVPLFYCSFQLQILTNIPTCFPFFWRSFLSFTFLFFVLPTLPSAHLFLL